MTFSWLPDAERDPHPRLTWFTECCFDWTISALFRKEEMLPPDYRLEPGTLVVSNHQRDADVPILTTMLCRREGVHIRWPLPFYASREDFMRRGFLADHLMTWPAPLRAPFWVLSLAWFFRIVRAEPMRRTDEFTLLDAFRALDIEDENARAAELNARGRREAQADKAQYDKNFWGIRRLARPARAALAPGFRATVDAQLARFAELLDAGRVVDFAPEGTISPNGRMGRIRAGVWRIVRLANRPPPILPAALSYDPLGPGRLRVIVRIGSPLRAYNAKSRREFDAWLKGEIMKLYPVTASHLASRFLAAGPERFTTTAFARWCERAVTMLAAAGCTLDPLLEHSNIQQLAEERLGWLAHKSLLAHTDTGWRNRWSRDAEAGWRRPANIVRYLDNALDDLLCGLAPGLELRP
ncbi:MAG: lysophospholipid acyltransferase family protein [Gammaproteobacteria bacterium]